MKEYTKEQRWALAVKLDGILGADLTPDEETAIEQAIEIICPEFTAMRDAEDWEAAEFFGNLTPEEQDHFIAEEMKKYPLFPDSSGTPAVGGKIVHFRKDGNDG